MKLLLAILFLVALAVVVVLSMRRGSGDVPYRRRFDNRHRRDPADATANDSGVYVPLFMAGATDHGAQSHAHGQADCGASAGHVDGGAGCDGGN